MKKIPTVKSAMTPFPYSVDIDAPVSDAMEFMRKHQIRHLPVTDKSALAGIITDRDIKLLLGPEFAFPDAHDMKVGEAMIADAYVVDLNTRLDEVLEHMAEHHLGSSLVTRKGKLAGVFTVTDACRVFADLLRQQIRRSGGDAAA